MTGGAGGQDPLMDLTARVGADRLDTETWQPWLTDLDTHLLLEPGEPPGAPCVAPDSLRHSTECCQAQPDMRHFA